MNKTLLITLLFAVSYLNIAYAQMELVQNTKSIESTNAGGEKQMTILDENGNLIIKEKTEKTSNHSEKMAQSPAEAVTPVTPAATTTTPVNPVAPTTTAAPAMGQSFPPTTMDAPMMPKSEPISPINAPESTAPDVQKPIAPTPNAAPPMQPNS